MIGETMTQQGWALAGRAGLASLLLAAGCWLIIDATVFSRTRRLGDRISAQLGPSPADGVSGLRALVARIAPMGAGRREGLEARLRAAGRNPDAMRYRATTVLACVVCAGVLVLGFLLASALGTLKPVPALVALLGTIVGVIAWRSTSLTRAVTRRKRIITAQFPLLADLLALGVAAGEAVAPALHRAGRETGGPLGDLVADAVARTSSGVPLSTALRGLAARADVPAVDDCVESILVAGERGTPLAAVLRDQATDARELERRTLIEAGGKAEISMMAPVVFGLLPLSVLFVVFPSIDLLSLSL